MTQEPVSGFHVLSDPIRLQIVGLLKDGEFSVSDISEKLSTPQSILSFHLRSLKAAGLVVVREQGRWLFYSLNREQFDLL